MEATCVQKNTGRRPKMCASRDVLEYLITIGLSCIKIGKLFHTQYNLVNQWKKTMM